MIVRAIQILIGTLAFAIAAPTPSIACGGVPAPGAEIDRMMAIGDAQKAHPDIDVLRTRISVLARSGDDYQARKLEEDAMRLLGFQKLWLRCGKETFAWIRIDPNRMIGPAPQPATAR